jgi:hypothetical protein
MNKVILTLINSGFIQTGTIVGVGDLVRSPKTVKRFAVEGVKADSLTARHIDTNLVVNITASLITEVDGMSVNRYLDYADLDEDGVPIYRGKKRGRRPKPKNP